MPRRRILVPLAAAAILLLLFLLGRHYLDLADLARHEQTLRKLVERHWWSALAAGFLLYVLTSMVPGTTGKSLVFAWLFGFWWSAVIINGALTLAAIAAFGLSRYVLQQAIESRFAEQLRHVDRGLARHGARFLLMLRLLHAPYTLVNYSLGTTRVPLRTFWWTTQLGLLPGNIVFAYAGSRLPTLRQVAEEGAKAIFTWEMIVALILLSAFPLLVHWVVEHFWTAVAEEAETAIGH